MLYPFILTTPNADGSYKVNPGSGRAFSFDVPSGGSVKAIVVQTMLAQQDFSLRCWISAVMADATVSPLPPNHSLWPANRLPHPQIIIYDEALPRPDGLTCAVTPGTYFLNVLNMTNAKNSFAVLLTD